MLDLIAKTRDRIPLTPAEIGTLVAGITDGRWPDYQLAAWLMAAYLNGLSEAETFALADAMARSGTPPAEPLGVVDKHSTGGVGDKTTLVLAPLVASLGIPVAKMSGRGLGHTGGTLDKLEAIPGFRVALDTAAVRRQVAAVGVAVVAQSPQLAPADGRLYALRDVTATVDSIPLIATSVMSKKLAAGTPNIVLDVKTGRGAFMRDRQRARELAGLMVRIGTAHGRRVRALLTNMDQPLGWAVGNALEVNEAAACLQNQGPADLREEVLHLAGHMVALVRGTGADAGREEAACALADGRGWDRFQRWITAQGGDAGAVARGLPVAPVQRVWRADRTAVIAAVDARRVGEAALALGAGRHRLGDRVDPAVGVLCRAKTGQTVRPGDELGVVYARSAAAAEDALAALGAAVTWSAEAVAPPPLVWEVLGGGEPA
ncbi:Pyrimidine-nucleoside phosphorylase [Candidatus Hydrogenisulfobacillus filiaventi]|uniref:Pyrimidine-nucleoside phosphorylase n=1 Tax=Candidatus Hydrogenisulfobacillus filiaventi TaxID=2707344 RepID=A0A6F8ZEV5_9FIRM|nr:thymidine phosphorylase [Bacillota bacterium]CAB1128307.1 Pyrimidine-nucleoside phosphorylase [Candidatus Hydrogenisulfobacillus filiaventi]